MIVEVLVEFGHEKCSMKSSFNIELKTKFYDVTLKRCFLFHWPILLSDFDRKTGKKLAKKLF